MSSARLSLIAAPTSEPVSLEEAKAHLRIIGNDDDDYITNLIAAARDKVETLTQRALISQEWLAIWDSFPAGRVIKLPKGQVQSISHVKYYADGASVLSDLSSSLYRADLYSNPARIILLEGCSWPTPWDEGDAVQVQFVAGYGDTAASVPAELKQAILMLISHWFSVRSPVVGYSVSEMPKSVEYLALPYRVWGASC